MPFEERLLGEKQGQRRRRFLQYLRELPHSTIKWDPALKKFVPKPEHERENLKLK